MNFVQFPVEQTRSTYIKKMTLWNSLGAENPSIAIDSKRLNTRAKFSLKWTRDSVETNSAHIPNESPLTDFSLANLIRTLLTLCTFCRELLTVKRLGLIVKKTSDFPNFWRRRFVEIIARQGTEANFHLLRAALLAVVFRTDAKVISYGKDKMC